MSVRINGTTGVTTPNLTATTKVTTADLANTGNYNGGQLGNRNLIINGAMKIAQRGDSVTLMAAAGYQAGPDRFRRSMNQSGGHQVTRERTTEVPAGSGLSYSLKETITTAGNEVASKWAHRPIDYRIEGQDVQHLQHGTSNAKSVTLSFWVRSNKTGIASVLMTTYDSSSGTRNIAPRYTINAANTWEYKTITVAGDTGGNGIKNDQGLGFGLVFYGGAGAGYQVADQSSTWGAAADNWWFGCTLDINNVNDFIQFAGLQLEVGETTTPFEHRSYGDELAKCQRYYERTGTVYTSDYGGSHSIYTHVYNVVKRAVPTVTLSGFESGTVTGTGTIHSNYVYRPNNQAANSGEAIYEAEL